jgi:cell division septum initiation protein DivIVA
MELIDDIEATLDQLLANAEALKQAALNPELAAEVTALQNMQESLLSRLMDRHDRLANNTHPENNIPTEKLEQKIADFHLRQSRLMTKMRRTLKKQKS